MNTEAAQAETYAAFRFGEIDAELWVGTMEEEKGTYP